ncbi:hypothetical protein [Rhodococcus sp. X156]|uniref:hypothetical protein n=1 Tax=Rhodococcus sp. X156 TaxID=2499145 RepID=UPI0013E3CE1D|nr:hypothetical protein [Rhodococcus sp. X156]
MSTSPLLFAEPGGRWRTVAYGPALCLLAVLLELGLDVPVHWFTLIAIALLLAGIAALQVVGARRHCTVELTPTVLRQGTEELPVREIAAIFDEPGERAWDDELEPWELARALGESHSVPRHRVGVGLELADGRLVQAWARKDRALRSALQEVVHP